MKSILRKLKITEYTIKYSQDNPAKDKIHPNELVIVGQKKYPKWVFMICPCGCGEIITLSLMRKHKPNWSIKIDKLYRPTLYPSVWKEDGCESHFCITKGKIQWAGKHRK